MTRAEFHNLNRVLEDKDNKEVKQVTLFLSSFASRIFLQCLRI